MASFYIGQTDYIEKLNTLATVNDLNQVEDFLAEAAASAAAALVSENNSAASALTALNAPGTSATSTTSLTIGTGSKSLTIQTGKALVPGMDVVIAYTTAPNNRMIGIITSYNSGTGALVVDSVTAEGSGTYANWTVSLGLAHVFGTANNLTIENNATIGLYEATSVHTVKGIVSILASSSSPALLITQIGSGDVLRIEDSASTDATPFVISNNGTITSSNPATFGSITITAGDITAANGYSFLFGDGSVKVYGDSSTDDLSLYTNSTERLTINSSGNVGIGGTPTNRLDLFSNTNSDSLFRHYNSNTGGSTTVTTELNAGGRYIRSRVDYYNQYYSDIGSGIVTRYSNFDTHIFRNSSGDETLRLNSVGNIGFGTSIDSSIKLRIGGTFTAGNVIKIDGTIPSSATSGEIFNSLPTLASGTIFTSLAHYSADQVIFSAGSSATTQIGFLAKSTLIGATYNYGFYSDIAAATGRYNFYSGGSAPSYFAGQIQSAVAPGTAPFIVASNTRVTNLNAATAGTADQISNNYVIKFDTGTSEGIDLYTFNGSSAKTIDIKAGTNITFTKTSNTVTISASGGGSGSTNADTVDGYHVGTSGGTIPVLSNSNVWGNTNLFTKAIIEKKSNPSISSNVLTIDLSDSAIFVVNLTSNINTLTLSNPAPTGYISTFVLEFIMDGGARTISWPSSIKWSGGTSPTLTSTSTKRDAFVFYTYDGGSTYIASIIGQNF